MSRKRHKKSEPIEIPPQVCVVYYIFNCPETRIPVIIEKKEVSFTLDTDKNRIEGHYFCECLSGMHKFRIPGDALVSIGLHCPSLQKEIEVSVGDAIFTSYSHPCELCGAHGDVAIEFTCECGETHKLALYEW